MMKHKLCARIACRGTRLQVTGLDDLPGDGEAGGILFDKNYASPYSGVKKTSSFSMQIRRLSPVQKTKMTTLLGGHFCLWCR